MLLRAFVGVVVVGILSTISASVQGQTSKPADRQSQWLFVNIVKVNPGAVAEYIDLQTKEAMPALKKGGAKARQAWSSGLGGAAREFVYMSPIESFAQFDKPGPMITALGQEGAAALGAKTTKLSEQIRTMVVRTRPDLSYVPDPAMTSPLALVSIVEIVPGRRSDFEAFLKKEVLPAMQQAKAKSYSVVEVVYGDPAGAYVTAVGYDTHEAIGKGHPFQLALGEDGARKLEAKATGIVSRLERFVSRHRPELSWSEQPGTK